jgi:hypothetical protein
MADMSTREFLEHIGRASNIGPMNFPMFFGLRCDSGTMWPWCKACECWSDANHQISKKHLRKCYWVVENAQITETINQSTVERSPVSGTMERVASGSQNLVIVLPDTPTASSPEPPPPPPAGPAPQQPVLPPPPPGLVHPPAPALMHPPPAKAAPRPPSQPTGAAADPHADFAGVRQRIQELEAKVACLMEEITSLRATLPEGRA